MCGGVVVGRERVGRRRHHGCRAGRSRPRCPGRRSSRSAAAAIIWFIASPTAESSSSVSSSASVLGRGLAHHRRGQARARRRAASEDVAAGDAVDVGDLARRPGRARPERDRVRPTTVTSPGAEPRRREHLQHAGDRLGGGLAQADQGVVGVIAPSSTAAGTWTARRLPLRPGLAAVDGYSSAKMRDAAARAAVEAQDVAGLQREHLLDRHLDCLRPRRAPSSRRRRRRGADGLGGRAVVVRGPASSRAANRPRPGRSRTTGRAARASAEIARRCAPRHQRQRRLAEPARSAPSRSCGRAAEDELDLATSVQISESCASRRSKKWRASAQSMSVSRRSLAPSRRSRRAAARSRRARSAAPRSSSIRVPIGLTSSDARDRVRRHL